MADKTATIYKVQMHMYSLDIINFIIAEATAKKLSIRDFKGVSCTLFSRTRQVYLFISINQGDPCSSNHQELLDEPCLILH